jgi:hypothetical protein
MKEQRFSRFSVAGVRMVVVLSLAVLVFAGACATTPRTGLDRSQQVFEDYMAGRVSAEHIYYTTGPQNAPDAILAVSRKYTLRSERWAKREMTEATLREMVGSMNVEFNATSSGLIGAYVVDEKGKQIGLWYSAVGLTTVEMLSDTEVRIDPPLTAAINQLRDQGGR